jgi:carbonic anhydrase
MTISSDDLVRRNAVFAATGAFAGLPFPTSDTLQVLGCVDSRVDPSDVLGLELGEGVVMRNIGGRITPATLRSWALLGRLSQGQPPRSGHLVILHHTDCGITRLALVSGLVYDVNTGLIEIVDPATTEGSGVTGTV